MVFQFGDKVVNRECALDLATVLQVDGDQVEVLWHRPYSDDGKEWVAAERLMLAADYHLLDSEVAFAEVQAHNVADLEECAACRRKAFQLRAKAMDLRSRENQRIGNPRDCETTAKTRRSNERANDQGQTNLIKSAEDCDVIDTTTRPTQKLGV